MPKILVIYASTHLLVRLLMHQMHRPIDVSRDYDYTDWDAVDGWAHEFMATVGRAVTPAHAGSLR